MDRAGMLAELYDVLNTTASGPWRESVLLGYLSEGQDKFCEQTGYFTDFTSFTITLEADKAIYPIPDRVIQILDIWDGTRRLGKYQEEDRRPAQSWDSTIDPTVTGRPCSWQTDQETGSITFDRTPGATEVGVVLTLRVWRYSLYDLAGDGATPGVAATPEIPSRFHRAPIEWAAYKAFNHHDMETQDPVKATDHLAAFALYVRDGKTAMQRYHGHEVRVGTSPAYRT